MIAAGGCEGIFAGPLPEHAAGGSTGESSALDSVGDPPFTTGEGGESDAVDDSGAGEAEADLDGGPRLDLGSDTSGTPPPPHNGGDCCAAAKGIGCADPVVEDCVCAVDPACCESGWDELCAVHVEQLGCGGCIGTTGTRDTGQDCCLAHGEPGCIDVEIAACVCASDPYCCMVGWDQVCVDQVIELGCDDCIEPFVPVDYECCVDHVDPGCDDLDVMTCVCEQDEFCCVTMWDVICVNEVEGLDCGVCSDQAGTGESDELASTGDGLETGASSSSGT
ncbi:MAG TPA: hypothetical protein VFG69_13950 [Nannocystaceae bacterium]|nr:hypothetical protein [Nannocystaceae bacterium]